MTLSRFASIAAAFALIAAGALTAAAQGPRPQGESRPGNGVKSASRPSQRSGDARSRWNALTDEEKERYRKLFDELRKLPESERALVKERLKNLGEEKRKLESNLTAPDRAALESLDGDAREAWLRKAAAELMRSRDARVRGLVDPEQVKAMSDPDPVKRSQAITEVSDAVSREAIRRFTDYAKRRKILTAEEADQFHAMPIPEAMPKIAAMKKDLIVADVERKPELRAEVGEEVWEQVKSLPPEQFLQRIEAMRAFHKSVGRGHHGPSSGGPGSRSSMGRQPRGGPRGGPQPGGPDFEVKIREEARKTLKAQGLTDEEIEKKLQEPIWKLLRPKPKPRGFDDRPDSDHRGRESRPSSRRGM